MLSKCRFNADANTGHASASSWLMLVPSNLRLPAPFNLGVSPFIFRFYAGPHLFQHFAFLTR